MDTAKPYGQTIAINSIVNNVSEIIVVIKDSDNYTYSLPIPRTELVSDWKYFFTGYGDPANSAASKYLAVAANLSGVKIGLLSGNITTSSVNFAVYYRI